MKKFYLVWPMMLLVLAACASSGAVNGAQPTGTEVQATVERTPTLLPNPTATVELTPTMLPTLTTTIMPPTPTWTPLPTLNPKGAQSLVNNLLVDNAGCRLPCYWGITPGKTTWQEAESFLQTFALVNIRGPVPASGSIAALIPYPKERGTIWHYYGIKQGIVDEIIADNLDLAPSLYLQSFLKTYGQPSGIWIRTFKEEERNSQPFLIDIFYQEQGILMEYGGGDLNDLSDRIQNCLDNNVNSPFIYLWSPDNQMDFDQVKERFLDTENFPEPVPLHQATGISVDDFYSNMITAGMVCIETPKALWP